MDEALIAQKGITATNSQTAMLDSYRLTIGERATLVREAGHCAYGVLMDIDAAAIESLYATEGLEDYRPEQVKAQTTDGQRVDAVCFNLPSKPPGEANRAYANALLDLAERLNFPESYLAGIRRQLIVQEHRDER